MIKTAFVFLVGAAAGAAACWFLMGGRITAPPGAGASISRSAAGLADRLGVDEIKAELGRTGTIVREKARQAGASISDAAANARITATIKAKFLTDRSLPSFQIGVDTTDGVVTLSGKVDSAETVARAVRIALDTDGVHKVFSTVQVMTPLR
jgi:hyperosmotically inducible protein